MKFAWYKEPISDEDEQKETWKTEEIPFGQYIIGFRVNTNAVPGQISRLDFLLGGTPWIPDADGYIEFGASGEQVNTWDARSYPWT